MDVSSCFLDRPITMELDEAKFKSLRDLGINVVPETTTDPGAPVVPKGGAVAGLPLPIQSAPIQSAPQYQPTLTAPSGNMPTGNMMDMPINALPSIANLVDRVSPSVVNIVVTTDSGETTSEGQGSGFVISNKLEVVTNYHVIEGGTNIEIEFNDGRRYSGLVSRHRLA